jgi:hypothetical protein
MGGCCDRREPMNPMCPKPELGYARRPCQVGITAVSSGSVIGERRCRGARSQFGVLRARFQGFGSGEVLIDYKQLTANKKYGTRDDGEIPCRLIMQMSKVFTNPGEKRHNRLLLIQTNSGEIYKFIQRKSGGEGRKMSSYDPI